MQDLFLSGDFIIRS